MTLAEAVKGQKFIPHEYYFVPKSRPLAFHVWVGDNGVIGYKYSYKDVPPTVTPKKRIKKNPFKEDYSFYFVQEQKKNKQGPWKGGA